VRVPSVRGSDTRRLDDAGGGAPGGAWVRRSCGHPASVWNGSALPIRWRRIATHSHMCFC